MEKLYSDTLDHRNNFDVVRFILAVMVVLTHAYPIYYGTPQYKTLEPLMLFTHGQLTFGTMAVGFFFMISGFLVLKSLLYSKSTTGFITKRVLRIYPAFIVVSLFCAIIVVPLGNGGMGQALPDFSHYWSSTSLRYLARSTATLKAVYLPETLSNVPIINVTNGSIWTIRYEFGLYLLLALLGMTRLFKVHKLVPLFIFLAVLSINVLHHEGYVHWLHTGKMPGFYLPPFLAPYREQYLWTEHFLLYFTSGMCFYACRDYIPRSRYLMLLSVVVLLITARWTTAFELTVSVFGAYLLFYFTFSSKIRLHNFAKYGDFSYGIYLFGWPIQQLVTLYLGKQIGFYGTLFTSIAFVIPIAFLSWHLVEKPALSLKNKSIGFRKLKDLKASPAD